MRTSNAVACDDVSEREPESDDSGVRQKWDPQVVARVHAWRKLIPQEAWNVFDEIKRDARNRR